MMDESAARAMLIRTILTAYNTTRFAEVDPDVHILSKEYVRRAFQRYDEKIAVVPPPQIDPDLIEARRICAETADDGPNPDYVNERILSGDWDGQFCVRAVLAGIKRGRELAA